MSLPFSLDGEKFGLGFLNQDTRKMLGSHVGIRMPVQGRRPAAVRVAQRRQRLKAARDLLRSTSLPLQEIARRSGFFSARQLSKAFQREYGKLPRRDGRSWIGTRGDTTSNAR